MKYRKSPVIATGDFLLLSFRRLPSRSEAREHDQHQLSPSWLA
jgi:hypothetical protein